jgi:hypothetical protein
MGARAHNHAARLRRLDEELVEAGFAPSDGSEAREQLLIELDYALRPAIHERRIPSFGSIVEPTVDPDAWDDATQLNITHGPLRGYSVEGARRFADGMSSFLVRRLDGRDEFVVFDRPAGSERDLVVLAEAVGGTIVQRHPSGDVRLVGAFGVMRWDGLSWHHELPISTWIDAVSACGTYGDRKVIAKLLAFAVHDLGARGIGALLVYEPAESDAGNYQIRFPVPPPLRIDRAADLAPLRHVLGQIDGAAVFDRDGVLRQLGVRLVPSAVAEADVEGLRGMRHTSGRRFSYDEPDATVIVVSDDGPVTVLRAGRVLGSSSEQATAMPTPAE